MWKRYERPWRAAQQRMNWAWGLLTLLGLWFAPTAQAADAWTLVWTNDGLNGAIVALANDPATPGTVYVATTFNGLFRSSDEGASWVPLNPRFDRPNARFDSIMLLAVDPTAPGTLYASGSYGDGSFGTSGLFKSTDGGAYWTQVSSVATRALLFDPAAPGTVYSGSLNGNGVLKSTNGGVSWAPMNSGLTSLNVLALVRDPAAPGTIYAGTASGGVFKSTNGGASWAATNSGLTYPFVPHLAADDTAPGTLYAGTGGGGLFKSTNGGASWIAVNGGLPDLNIVALALDSTAPGTVYAGVSTPGIYKSMNGGATWAAVNSGINDDPRLFDHAIDNSASRVYAANALGSLYILNASTPLPDSGQPVTLPLPNGGSITASAQQPGTQVQLVRTDTGASVAVVTVGSALLQPSAPGQPVAGLPRGGGLTVLTPSCTAARVVVTATGDTHTAYTDGCAVAVSGAGDAVPTPAQGLSAPQGTIRAEDVQFYLPGPVTQRSMLVNVRLDGAAQQTVATQRTLARAGGFNVYVIALVPGNLVARVVPLFLQKHATGGWRELTMPVAALMSNIAPQTTDARILIEVLKDTDMRLLPGTEIYIGYGMSDEEMLQAGRYRALVRIQ